MNFLQWIRDSRRQPAAQGLVTFLVCQLVLPLSALTHAGPVVDPNANVSFQPVIRDYSGIPVIDIVAPNAAGVSHNKYIDFDIDEKGLVFNNSLVNANSQLVQNLLANPNFGARTAATILNEVTGASDSQLKGVAEIFGDNANLIIANPNGITCNGCGFLNTERLTLTTGAPTYDGQKLQLNVNDGRITFDEEGLNYRSMPESIDLLSRYITMNGELIIPGELNLITGRYLADYQKIVSGELNDAIKVKELSDASPEALAIDGTVFGAMQAGKISIMATEDGLGVKSDGYLASRADDLFIESAGGLSITNADSFKKISLSAKSDILIRDDITANENISINAQNVKTFETSDMVSKNINIAATEVIAIDGMVKTLDLSMNATDIISAADIVAITALNTNAVEKQVYKDAEVITNAANMNGGEIYLENIKLESDNLIIDAIALELDEDTSVDSNAAKINIESMSNNGEFLTVINSDIIAKDTINNNGTLVSLSDAKISAGTLNNKGDITAENLSFNVDYLNNVNNISADRLFVEYDQVVNGQASMLQANDAIYSAKSNGAVFENLGVQIVLNSMEWLHDNSVRNSGLYKNGGSLRGHFLVFSGLEKVINGLDVDGVISGSMLSDEVINIGNEEFEQYGTIETSSLVIARTSDSTGFTNAGAIYSDEFEIELWGDFTNSGSINSNNIDLILKSGGEIDNSGYFVFSTLDAQSDSSINSKFLNREAGLISQKNIFNEDGRLVRIGHISLSDFHSVENRGAIEVDEILSINDVYEIINSSSINDDSLGIFSNGLILFDDVNRVVNGENLVSRAVNIRAGSFENTGLIFAPEVDISSFESEFLNNGSLYQSGLSLSAEQRDRFSILAFSDEDTFNISSSKIKNDTSGTIEIYNGQIISSTGQLENNGLIREVESQNIDHSLSFSPLKYLKNSGDLSFSGRLLLSEDSFFLNDHDGYLHVDSIGISNGAILGDFTNKGTLVANDNISLTSDAISNEVNGNIFSNLISLESHSDFTNYGLIQGWSDVSLSADGNINNYGVIVGQGDYVTISADNLTNAGDIIGLDLTSINVNQLSNRKLIYGSNVNIGSVDQSVVENRSADMDLNLPEELVGVVASENLNLYIKGSMSDSYQANEINLVSFSDLQLSGNIISDTLLNIGANDFTVTDTGRISFGALDQEASLWTIASSFRNQGDIDFGSNFTLNSASFRNTGNITGYAQLELNANSIINELAGLMSLGGITGKLYISGQGDGFSYSDRASIFSNEGSIFAEGGFDLSSNAVTVSGNIKSGGDSEWYFNSLTNDKRITIDGLWSLGDAINRVGSITNNDRLYAKSISLHASGSFINGDGSQVVSYDGGVSIDSLGFIYNNVDSVIYGKSYFDLHAQGQIENFGVIESFLANDTSSISASVINNGDGTISNGQIIAAGHLNIDGSVNNLGYSYGPKDSYYEAIGAYSFGDWTHSVCTERAFGKCISHATRYNYQHSLSYISGYSESRSYRSMLQSGGELNILNGDLNNISSDVVSGGNIIIDGSLNNTTDKLVDLTSYNLSWKDTNVNSHSHKSSFGNDLQSQFNSSDPLVKEGAINLILRKVNKIADTIYWDTLWASNDDGDEREGEISGQSPWSGFTSATSGKIVASGTLSYDGQSSLNNIGTITAKEISNRDREDNSNAAEANTELANDLDLPNSDNIEDKIKGSFTNGLDDSTIELAISGPKSQVSLLDYVDPDLLLNNGNTDNTDYAGMGPSLFDLDPDILNQIIADTEFELQPYYIFERIDESQIPEVTPVFFFDPYQEAQLLTQAALQQTGTAYFSDDWDSSAEQRQALYDNTVLYLNENQDVEIGTPLSEDVIANLNAPMMWYVSMDIGGQSQLVPTVYLPQATLDQITTPEAGSIVADTMDVNVEEFSNSGNIKVAGVASIYAKSFENQRNVFTFGDDKNYGTTVSDGGNISAGTLAVTSEGDINNNGGSLKTTGDMSLVAGGDINFNAVEVNRRSQHGENVTENTRFLLSDIVAGGNVTFDAEGNLVSQAAQVNVDGDATINAENILLGGVVERDYEKTVEKRNGTFSSTTITKTSESLDFVGSDFNVGGDANLTAGNKIVLQGSTVDAEGNVDVYAENGITVEAGISQQTDTRLREDSNSVRMATTDSGSITQTAVAAGISSGGDLTLDTNGDINILASKLSSGGDMVIGDFDLLLDDEGLPVMNEAGQFMAADGTTVGNVNIGTVELKDESWSVRETSLKGPLQDLATVAAATLSLTGAAQQLDALGIETSITVASSESTRTQSTTNVGSELNSDGRLLVNAEGDVTIAGSQVNVGESAVIQAENVLVTAVENTTTTTHSQSEHTIDSSDVSVGAQEVTVAGFTDTQHTETTTTSQTTLGMAGINVGLNHVDENGNAVMPENPDERATLSIAATNDIDILSSDVNVIGDAQLTANNITVGGLQETTTTTHEDETITTTTSVGVKNAYVDTVYAADAVTKAAEGVEEAEALLRDAEKRVKDGSLAQSALDDYKINLAAATSQLAQATLNLASSGATAAGTTGTGGFYASASASTTETKNTSTSTQSNFVGSNLNVSGNATFNANKALNIIGSTAQVGGHAQLDAEDINITAGENTYSEESTSSTKTVSASVSTAAPTSVNGSLSNSDTVASASGTTYTNSFISAGSLGSTSDNMTIAGATVMTEGDLDIDTNNLVIKSLQDTHQSSSETTGGSVGGSDEGVPSSVGYNQSNSTSDSAMVTQQTMLIGGTSGKGEVNLTADKTTIAGAVVASATINDDGTLTDNGTLNIVTDELIIEDIQDHNTSSTEGFSLDTATSGTGTTTVGATNLGNNLEQTTLATLGAGNITKKDGTAHDVSGVNSDLNNTQEVTLDQQTGGLDATVTVDQRVFSEGGRDQIKEDFVKSDMILDTIELMATTDKVGITDFFSETGKKHTTYEAIKEEIRTNPDLAKALQNPDLSAEDKEVMLNQLTHTVMAELGYETEGYENKIVDNENSIRVGFYSEQTGDAYINDGHVDNTEDLVTVSGHEASHAMDALGNDGSSEKGREIYATSYGENFASYTNLGLDINGYDDGMASTNNHVGNGSQTVKTNNSEFTGLDYSKGDSYLTPDQQKELNEALDNCSGSSACEYNVARAFGNLDDMQEVQRRLAQIKQIGSNVSDGVSATLDIVTSPIESAKKAYDSLTGLNIDGVVGGLNQMADDQHQTLVDRDNAYIDGDSETLGQIEGDFATESMGSLSIPGGFRAAEKVVEMFPDMSAKSRTEGMGGNGSFEAEGDFGLLNQTPHDGTMTSVEVRQWYLDKERKIESSLDPNSNLEKKAKQAYELRNEIRSKARDLMEDRKLAEDITKNNPNLSWEDVQEKARNNLIRAGNQKPTVEQVYNEVISSSQRSRTSVNEKLGVK